MILGPGHVLSLLSLLCLLSCSNAIKMIDSAISLAPETLKDSMAWVTGLVAGLRFTQV